MAASAGKGRASVARRAPEVGRELRELRESVDALTEALSRALMTLTLMRADQVVLLQGRGGVGMPELHRCADAPALRKRNKARRV